MAVDAINPRKRRRGRRRIDKPAISARLLLDDRLKGEHGYMSDDLLADLFPSRRASHGEDVLSAAPYTSADIVLQTSRNMPPPVATS